MSIMFVFNMFLVMHLGFPINLNILIHHLLSFFVYSFIVHCRSMCPKDALVQRSARTIMILVQRVSEKDGNDTETNSFPLTQPRPAPSTQAASGSSFTSASAQATNTASSIPTTQGLNF